MPVGGRNLTAAGAGSASSYAGLPPAPAEATTRSLTTGDGVDRAVLTALGAAGAVTALVAVKGAKGIAKGAKIAHTGGAKVLNVVEEGS